MYVVPERASVDAVLRQHRQATANLVTARLKLAETRSRAAEIRATTEEIQRRYHLASDGVARHSDSRSGPAPSGPSPDGDAGSRWCSERQAAEKQFRLATRMALTDLRNSCHDDEYVRRMVIQGVAAALTSLDAAPADVELLSRLRGLFRMVFVLAGVHPDRVRAPARWLAVAQTELDAVCRSAP